MSRRTAGFSGVVTPGKPPLPTPGGGVGRRGSLDGAALTALRPDPADETAYRFALFGVPLAVRAFSAFTGDEELLTTGRTGRARITRLEPPGWRYNRTHPIVRFALEVDSEAVYPAEVKQAVDPARLAELVPAVRPSPALAIRRTRRVW